MYKVLVKELFPWITNDILMSKGMKGMEHYRNTYTHAYIIDHYNLSVRIIDLVSHATYVACVNFIPKWRNLQFKVDFECQIFLETLQGTFINSEFLPETCILFKYLPWVSNPGFTSFTYIHAYIVDHYNLAVKNTSLYCACVNAHQW